MAAYELDKQLGLNLVPATVERPVHGRPAAVTWWLDDVAMNEVDRRRKGIEPPDQGGWDRQVQAVRVFDELISNTYRDTAPPLYLNSVWDNLLITTDWTIWITDHTGAFRTRQALQDPETLVRCPRSVLGRLRELNRPRLQQTLERYLSTQQLDALEVRRTLLVKHFDGQIESNGELPLPCIDRRAETYRIYQYTGGEFGGFWLVGVSRSTNGSRLWAVVKPSSVSEARHVGRAVTPAEWDSIATRISAINFWTQPARLLPEPNREPWRGALSLEGYSSDRYHSVSRFNDDKGLRTVMEAFLEIARPLLNKAAK